MYSFKMGMICTQKSVCFSGQQSGMVGLLVTILKPQMRESFLSPHRSIISNRKHIYFCDYNISNKINYLVSGKHDSVTWIHTTAELSYVDPLKNSKVQRTVMTMNERTNDRKAKPKTVVKKPLKQRIIAELKHYYHGFKLFFINVKIASKLAIKRFRGDQLTRREHELLKRTLGDIFRLVPFSVFIVVPFLEFTLPIFLKLFPGMLPSTFQSKSEKEKKMVEQFKTKLAMTKFLQETLEDMPPLSGNEELSQLAKDFSTFFSKVRTSGQMPSSEEIIRYSKLFEDEITMDKLPRPQIIALCRVLSITPIGTTRFLRYQLRLKLRKLQIDDKIIQKEGINSLTANELKEACKVRGMRSVGISEERMKEQLQQWLDLSLIKRIPPSLLLLSQAFLLTDTPPSEESLAATIKALPSEVGTATQSVISERGGALDYETKIRVIKDELSKVTEETIELQKLEIKKRNENFMMDTPDEVSESMKAMMQKMDDNEDISLKDLKILEDALESKLFIEKDCLAELKHDLQQYEWNVQDLRKMMSRLKQTDVAVETLAAKRLHRKLVKMMKKLEDAMSSIEQRENEVLSKPVVLRNHFSPGIIKIEELLETIKQRKAQKFFPLKGEYRLSEILHKLDHDKDGLIKTSKVSKLLDLLNDDELIINNKKIDELIDILSKEEALATSQQLSEALKKVKINDSKKDGKNRVL